MILCFGQSFSLCPAFPSTESSLSGISYEKIPSSLQVPQTNLILSMLISPMSSLKFCYIEVRLYNYLLLLPLLPRYYIFNWNDMFCVMFESIVCSIAIRIWSLFPNF